MSVINELGRRITVIEGSEAEIKELRAKLHELGIDIKDKQYIELKPTFGIKPQETSGKAVKVSAEETTTCAEKSTTSTEKPEEKYPYIVGQRCLIIKMLESDAATVEKIFGKRNRVPMKDKESDSQYFFVLKKPNIEFSVFPDDGSDNDHKHITALKMLGLI